MTNHDALIRFINKHADKITYLGESDGWVYYIEHGSDCDYGYSHHFDTNGKIIEAHWAPME